jgi:hypothetical protein
MTYRQMKKYIKQLLAWWDYDIDIFQTKEGKAYILEEARHLKSKKHLKRYLDN